MDLISSIAQTFGGLVTLTALSAGFAFWLFRTFSEKWLASRFDRSLEELRHQQQRELETFRSRVSAMMDRTTKLQQREYEVLPAIWEKLALAYSEVLSFTSQLQTFTDASRMNEKELEELLASSELLESQKDSVRNTEAKDRTKAFAKASYWHRKAAVEEQTREFSRALRFQGLFVLPEIRDEATAIQALLWDALTEHAINEENEITGPREYVARKALRDGGRALMDSLEAKIQKRLWTVTTLDA